LPDITVHQIEHFFQHYKDLEPNKWVKITRIAEAGTAKRLIMESIERYNQSANTATS
jgi:inorganic pyrophosphatase